MIEELVSSARQPAPRAGHRAPGGRLGRSRLAVGPRSLLLLVSVLASVCAPAAAGAFFQERFDGAIPPALPTGWTVSLTGPAPAAIAWRTVTIQADSTPNSVSANDPGGISDNRLESPAILVSLPTAQLTFRNSFNLEGGFDGMVLEIAIGPGGSFQDILLAGGSFATGGYNGTINLDFGSPIAGRLAWTANSGGFITSRVNLPASASGQRVRFRWRVATDSGVAGIGAFVDSISCAGCTLDVPAHPDFDGDGKADLVVGAGPGGGPHVRVLSGATGTELFSVFPYAAAFTGGVRVAACDLNDDGVPDIVTAPGGGGGPHVRAFDGRTGMPLAGAVGSFFAYAPAFTAGVFVGCADVSGDGIPDIIVGPGPGGGPHVRVFSGATGDEVTGFFAFTPAFTGGVFVGP